MKTGFIGCGNMGGAMMHGILASGKCSAEEIMTSDVSEEALAARKAEMGILTTLNNKEVAAFADVLFLAVKPQFYHSVIQEIRDSVREDEVVVTIAAGKTLAWSEEEFGRPLKIIRAMPNSPALVQEGMMGMCPNAMVTEEELEAVRDICSGFSETDVITEDLMDVVTAVSGSSPAFVFMFIEALADGAVVEGMPRKKAYKYAAQTILGSAKMVLETGEQPGKLKDIVCTPGGTTIEAVRALEAGRFRSTVMEAVIACTEKSRKLRG